MTEYAGVEMYVEDQQMVVTNRLVRAGCQVTRIQFQYHEETKTADALVTVRTLRGPLGWYARRWLRRHPVEFRCHMWTVDRGWYEYVTSVQVT